MLKGDMLLLSIAALLLFVQDASSFRLVPTVGKPVARMRMSSRRMDASTSTMKSSLSLSTLVVSLGIFSNVFTFDANPSYAATSSMNGASATFKQAEVSMDQTIKKLEGTQSLWQKTGRKLVQDNRAIINTKRKELEGVATDMSLLTNLVENTLTVSSDVTKQFTYDLSAMREQTSLKYEAASSASESSTTSSSPSTASRPALQRITKLYEDARKSSLLVEKTETILNSLTSSQNQLESILSDLKVINTNLEESLHAVRTSEAQIDEALLDLDKSISGLYTREEGAYSTSQNIPVIATVDEGAQLFHRGVAKIEVAQKNSFAQFRQVQKSNREIQDLEKRINRCLDILIEADTSSETFEKENKISLGKMKTLLKSQRQKYYSLTQTSAQSAKKVESFNEKLNNIYGKQDTKTKSGRLVVNSVVPVLRDIEHKLTDFEKKSRETESYIQRARKEGDREYSKFKQYVHTKG
jgi:hypothetical protein